MAFKRLPNGYGQIDKLPGARRKPYRARKRIGTKDGKPVYATIGYFADKGEALKQLALVNDAELVKEPDITFGECLELWKQEYLLTRELPPGIENAITHLSPLVKRKIADLRAIDLESVINSSKIARTVKPQCITVLHGVFSYAIRHEIVTKDYSTVAKYATDTKTRLKREVWTAEEIKKLWEKYGLYEKIILVQLYTGMRTTEIVEMRRENTFPEERYMVGGVKTEAGKNRVIPIHSTIYMLIKEFYADGNEYLFTKKGKQISKSTLRKNVEKYGHLTHDARHSFVTQAYKCGIAEQDIKRIVGHAQKGVTQSTYIHIDYEYLVNEIDKLYY